MKNRIEDIEILRGISVLIILVHHAHSNLLAWKTPALEHFYSYFCGTGSVDLFFCISGFVIARDIVPRFSSSPNRHHFFITAIAFWMRRAWRLLPSAWICLVSILLMAALFNQSGAFGTFRSNFAGVTAALLQVANLHFAYTLLHPLGLGSTFHFWTLSLEEQFYLALPFLIFFCGRTLPWLAGAVILFQLLSVRPNYYYWILRTDAMLFGVLIAMWSRSPTWQLFTPEFLGRSRLARALALTALVAAFVLVGSNDLRVVEYQASVMAIIVTLLVWIASYDRNYLMASGPFKRVLVWVGSRSYAIYLWHVPVFFATREIWTRLSPVGTGFDSNWTLTDRYCRNQFPPG
jgi:peptidoglycan/LPS O-acetylase OafA/YrhL